VGYRAISDSLPVRTIAPGIGRVNVQELAYPKRMQGQPPGLVWERPPQLSGLVWEQW